MLSVKEVNKIKTHPLQKLLKVANKLTQKGPLFYNQINVILLFPKKLLEIKFLLKGCAA